MRCQEVDSCLTEVRAYLDNEAAGYSLLVNVQDYGCYHDLLQRLEQDITLEKVFVSDFCQEHGLPFLEEAYGKAFATGNHVLIGISQVAALRGQETLRQEVQRAANHRTKGHTVVLLEHAESVLESLVQLDLRMERRIVLWQGSASPLPHIVLAQEGKKGTKSLADIKGLLQALERFRGDGAELLVATDFSPNIFAGSLYLVRREDSPYKKLRKNYPLLADKAVEESFGKEADWRQLWDMVASEGSLEAALEKEVGPLNQLEWQLPKVAASADEYQLWLYWLALKCFPPCNEYLHLALQSSDSFSGLVCEIYMHLLEISWQDESFGTLYRERKELLDRMPENRKLVLEYCNKTGRWDRAGLRYLTDSTEEERFKVLQNLENYDYDRQELEEILRTVAPELALYVKPYVFTPYQTKISAESADMLDVLSDYFTAYKMQKLTNRLQPEFLHQVEGFALERPYNCFLPRCAVLRELDCKEAEAYFFDGLGIEFLSYIESKCEKLGLQAEVRLARCELPSITSQNKDFYQFFPEGKEIRKIDALDECKHHSKKYDYQKCREPLHLFEELSIIDKEMESIHSRFALGQAESAVIVSDHGASRLAVLKGSESSIITLEEKGQHSGRCAPADKDPALPYVAYENGYAVLANYDRFKGGRKADVEVHGGATLEEVLVPVILLSLPGERAEYSFVEDRLPFAPGKVPHLRLFSTQIMRTPVLKVKEKLFAGTLSADGQHADFQLEGIRRKGKYVAEVYEDGRAQGVKLNFEIYKETQEDDLGI